MINKPKILFIGDKWWAGQIKCGPCEWADNLWQSLAAVNLAEVDVFHFDEYYRVNGIKADSAVLEKIAEFKPQAICLIVHFLPDNVNTPSLETLETIKKRFSIPIFSIWTDFQTEALVKISDVFQPFIDFNGFIVCSVVFRRWQDMKRDTRKYSYFWTPKNPEYFCDPGKLRDIDISFLGGSSPDRLHRIDYLKKQGVNILFDGGERFHHLSVEEYSGIFQRSKIVLNFSRSGPVPYTNCRAFEVPDCGAMLLSEADPETAKVFIPNVDYVPYYSDRDLIRKIHYYLKNETKRIEIAKNGYLKAQKYYSARRFWKIILDKVEEVISTTGGGNILEVAGSYQLDQADDKMILANWGKKTIELPWPRLKYIPPWRALQLKIIDWFCSRRWTYKLYLCYKCKGLKDWRWFISKFLSLFSKKNKHDR